jgi:cytochrome b pre-mRNA-processing protein 3
MAIFGFLSRRRKNRELIGRLYGAVVAAARAPELYRDLGVEDTLDGRFEALTLHLTLVTRRLRAMPSPAPDMAQDLVDQAFSGFEAALREIGVGDITVPKRMKVMASAYLGRAKAYDDAIRQGDTAKLAEAIGRNLYGAATPLPENVEKMTGYVMQSVMKLDQTAMDAFLSDNPSLFAPIDQQGMSP